MSDFRHTLLRAPLAKVVAVLSDSVFIHKTDRKECRGEIPLHGSLGEEEDVKQLSNKTRHKWMEEKPRRPEEGRIADELAQSSHHRSLYQLIGVEEGRQRF